MRIARQPAVAELGSGRAPHHDVAAAAVAVLLPGRAVDHDGRQRPLRYSVPRGQIDTHLPFFNVWPGEHVGAGGAVTLVVTQ